MEKASRTSTTEGGSVPEFKEKMEKAGGQERLAQTDAEVGRFAGGAEQC